MCINPNNTTVGVLFRDVKDSDGNLAIVEERGFRTYQMVPLVYRSCATGFKVGDVVQVETHRNKVQKLNHALFHGKIQSDGRIKSLGQLPKFHVDEKRKGHLKFIESTELFRSQISYEKGQIVSFHLSVNTSPAKAHCAQMTPKSIKAIQNLPSQKMLSPKPSANPGKAAESWMAKRLASPPATSPRSRNRNTSNNNSFENRSWRNSKRKLSFPTPKKKSANFAGAKDENKENNKPLETRQKKQKEPFQDRKHVVSHLAEKRSKKQKKLFLQKEVETVVQYTSDDENDNRNEALVDRLCRSDYRSLFSVDFVQRQMMQYLRAKS